MGINQQQLGLNMHHIILIGLFVFKQQTFSVHGLEAFTPCACMHSSLCCTWNMHRGLNNFSFYWLLQGHNLANWRTRQLLNWDILSQSHKAAAALHADMLNAIDLPSILVNNAAWAAPVAQTIHGCLVSRTAKLHPELLAQPCKVYSTETFNGKRYKHGGMIWEVHGYAQIMCIFRHAKSDNFADDYTQGGKEKHDPNYQILYS